ncbi:hypothetical protein DPEC_G00176280 [Dallia pectoralis]|uniref:Uncharacterized protein n=1 Tax=Dallia pectoralis TaxID=75939 RepID=A0ACC2GED9_DALPE|nr:hypothetical protein DPEC_G00176280 [Dallia pectoralis]
MVPTLPLLLLCQLALYTAVASKKDCGRPLLGDGMDGKALHMVYSPGDKVVLSCNNGYTPTGNPRTIVCSASGVWTPSKLKCLAKSCSFPQNPDHGEMVFEDITYQSTINFTCHDGYTIQGASTIECLANGEWSEPPPKCLPLHCGMPPIPAHGRIVYDGLYYGNTIVFGSGVTYECRPPFVLVGRERGTCSYNGEWTEPPKCKLVTCPPPTNITNGYMTSDVIWELGYKDTVRYGCNLHYVLDGPVEIECLKTGTWSNKPVCRAPCSIELTETHYIRNTHLTDKTPHNGIINVHCINKNAKCRYAVQSQCIDGEAHIPECLKETNDFVKTFNSTYQLEITIC